MLDVREAVRHAVEFLPQMIGQPELKDLQVEEIEAPDLDGSDRVWKVTLSFLRESQAAGIVLPTLQRLAEQMHPRFERVYRVVSVDANSGEVLQVKLHAIHTVAA
jgi:hypothetical protein